MYLNKEDIALLKRQQKYQIKTLGFFGEPIAGEFALWSFLAVYIVLSVLAIASTAYSSCGWLMLGFAGGAVCMICKIRWHRIMHWHLIREITDWKRVEELICKHEKYIA